MPSGPLTKSPSDKVATWAAAVNAKVRAKPDSERVVVKASTTEKNCFSFSAVDRFINEMLPILFFVDKRRLVRLTVNKPTWIIMLVFSFAHNCRTVLHFSESRLQQRFLFRRTNRATLST